MFKRNNNSNMYMSINSIEVCIHLDYIFNLRLSNFIINSSILNTFLQNTTHFHSRLYYVQGNTNNGTTGVPAMQDYDGTRDRRARKQEVTARTGRMVSRLSCAGTVLRQPSGEPDSLRRLTLVVFLPRNAISQCTWYAIIILCRLSHS